MCHTAREKAQMQAQLPRPPDSQHHPNPSSYITDLRAIRSSPNEVLPSPVTSHGSATIHIGCALHTQHRFVANPAPCQPGLGAFVCVLGRGWGDNNTIL
mmetsp:Transcript_109522/g.186138  ORF Transcript_109522/g.186138 Transcript_109522/m.186138 type:complete len:99 (-) Transcript_109522:55-351(-)